MGITYTLQSASALSTSTTWTDVTSILPTVVSNGDGTENADYAAIDALPAFASGQGFLRMKVTLTNPATEVVTDVEGFTKRTLAAACETFSMPYGHCPRLAGEVSGVSGTLLDCTAAAGGESISVNLVAGAQHYLEITNGPHEGHRLEVNEAATTGSHVAIDTASNLTTLNPLPPTLAGANFVLRNHHTIATLFPVSAFTGATGNPSTADRILLHQSGAFRTYWLYSNGGSPHWVDLSDAGLADAGGTVLAPSAGAFVHPKNSPVAMIFTGTVRANDLISPLPAGSTLVGSGWPIDQSVTTRNMTVATGFFSNRSPTLADKVLFWNGDTTPGATGYNATTYVRVSTLPRWVRENDATLTSQANATIFKSLRASFARVQTAKPAHLLPLPWTP
jgi:hypothetical protein